MDVPTSAAEKWDAAAHLVKNGKGKWVVVVESSARARNEKALGALTRRGLTVEVRSRLGHNTPDRPWEGWRTWARTL